jgi:PD-(D/E)XK endonuclease
MVGMTRFERATAWSQTRCASKLRHIPLHGWRDSNPQTGGFGNRCSTQLSYIRKNVRVAVSGRRESNPRRRLCRPIPRRSVTTALEPETRLELATFSLGRLTAEPKVCCMAAVITFVPERPSDLWNRLRRFGPSGGDVHTGPLLQSLRRRPAPLIRLGVGPLLYGVQVSRKTWQGDVGVATAILHYSRQTGTTVSVPTTEHCRYDLIIEDDRGLSRVQVKTSSFNARSGVYEVQLRTNGANYTTKNRSVKISCNEVDLVFILTGNGHAYEVPSKRLEGMTTVSMSKGWLKFKVGEYPPLAVV